MIESNCTVIQGIGAAGVIGEHLTLAQAKSLATTETMKYDDMARIEIDGAIQYFAVFGSIYKVARA